MLFATLLVGARDGRDVVLDPGDCRDVVAAVRAASPAGPLSPQVSAFRASVAPVTGCPACGAASQGAPSACDRHALEAALAQLGTSPGSGKAGAP